ncbi:hypothetical protein N665_0346s0003 [Sinapis alba]|nr:hypothetical protein N665_0346s0003 [Sinapis alba]
MKHTLRRTRAKNTLIQLNEVDPPRKEKRQLMKTDVVTSTVKTSEAGATDVVNPVTEEVAADEETSSEKKEQSKDGEDVESGTNDEEDTTRNDSQETESEAVPQHEIDLDAETHMLATKGKQSQDRLKMTVLYFLASVIVGGRKTGEGASLVESLFLKFVEGLDGRYAFDQNMNDVYAFLVKCNGVVPTSWVIRSFHVRLELLAFKAISSLRNYYQETVNGANATCPRMCKIRYKRKGRTKLYCLKEMNGKLGEITKIVYVICVLELSRYNFVTYLTLKLCYLHTHDIESILVAIPAEQRLLKRVMGKNKCWANDTYDATVDHWTKIPLKRKK